MKKVIALFFPLLLLSVPLNSVNLQSETYVYICTGRYSQCYHSKRNCSGLNNCQADIAKVTLSRAKSLHRRRCKKCY